MQPRNSDVPLAVIGLGCRFPGAENLDDYWKLIRDGGSGIVTLPADRLDRELYFDPEQGKIGRTYSQIGGVVPDRPINRDICPVSQELIDNSDSAHLVMLEVAAMACRHAGYDPFKLPQRNVGVYVGHSAGGLYSGDIAMRMYIEEITQRLNDDATFRALPPELQASTIKNIVDRVHREKPHRKADGGPELASFQVAGLVSQAFGLQGPYLAVDAACASSLIAMAIGAHALRQGLIDMAIVGGASCSKWYGLVLFSMARSISGTGSRPFDANADGLISSDGYAAVILKTLPKALADGDNICAVIRGVGISSDGRGKSLWAPRKEGQIQAIHRAYGTDVAPAELQYIECHATSTQVGDATELGALTMALKDKLPTDRKLPIGSVKANIGHTLESAGIAGFVKTVLCMQNRMLPGQINFNTPNPDVDWANIPFEVNRQTRAWPEPKPGLARRAAVNAFGIGGLNVHVVIDDEPTPELKRLYSVPANAPAQITVKDSSADDRSVAIIGRAAILPGALTLNAYWELLTSGRDPKTEAPSDRWNKEIYVDGVGGQPGRFKTALGGYVKDFVYDWKKHKVPPKQINMANPLQFMLLDAADQAFREAGYDKKAFDRTKAAAIVGSAFGGDFACQLQMGLRIPEFQRYLRDELKQRGVPADKIELIAEGYQKSLLEHMPALLDETGSFTASTLASRLTKTFDLMGGALALDAGDTSSMAAIHASMGLLLGGAVDMVLCAAGQRNMDLNVYEVYELKGMMSPGPTKPAYDVSGGKMVPAEGVGVVLLKRLADAQRDGDKIFGVIRGLAAAANCGNYVDNFRTAAERVLRGSGIDPAKVTVLEGARFAATEADTADVQIMSELFDSESRTVPMTLTSVTGQIGYSLGTSGMASLLKASLELEHGQVPQSQGLTQPIPSLADHADLIQVTDATRKLHATLPTGKTIIDVANSTSNGMSFHLLLEGGEKLPAAPAKKQPVVRTTPVSLRTIRLGAPTRDVLLAEVTRIAVNPEILFQTGGRDHFNGQDRVRLAVMAEDVSALSKKLRLVAELAHRPGGRLTLEQQGVYLQEVDHKSPKLAFLFPGQGSQYAGMLKELVAESPAAAEKVREINEILGRLGYGKFEDICWNSNGQLGTDVWTTQLAMLLANTVMFHVLTSSGIKPDVVAGHSYGEIPALVAAGVLSLEDAIRVTQVRTASVENDERTRGSLLSTTAPIDAVQRILGTLSGAVHLASHNAPDQTVVGGTTDGIASMKKLLEAEGFGCKVLAVPRPYHTPLLQSAREPFRSALAGITFRTPSLKFLSSVTNEYVTTSEAANRNLVEQLTTPVRYVDLVRKLVADGTSLLIEVGPQQILTRLNQRIVVDLPVSTVASDTPKQPGLAAIQGVKTLLETAGVSLTAAISAKPSVNVAATASPSRIPFFDATTRRRSRNGQAPLPVSQPVAAPVVVSTPAPVISNGHAAAVEVQAAPVSQPTVALDRDEVTAFMINFVVDQTGYPAEMVELDVDLEADLGIDSIKKAQLIGELAENYTLTHLSGQLQNLSLDDFRTIRSILDFVCQPGGAVDAASTPVVVETTAVTTEIKEVAAPVTVAAPAPVAEAVAQPAVALDREEVTAFMINFVVDQTGYPAEMVELDVDLEADLGIDSIKKAQLIGELAENYTLTHLSGQLQNLSLDDFRTIRSILDFVCQPGGAVEAASTPVVVETTAVTTEIKEVPVPVAVAAPAPVMDAAAMTTTVAQPAVALDRDEVTAFMINFVVDQTGYPAEMVELDVDLEADLGIDSIKKAQLIGELAENYTLTHLSGQLQNLSLDDFRTIRSILDFVCQPGGTVEVAGEASAPAAAAPAPVAVATPVPVESNGHATPELIVPAVSAPAVALNRDEVTAFMINFVVDQTGYPAEMVELDVDLEADLGIDSIKKAQLIGELAENYTLTHLSGQLQNLSLDDFRTIRSILDFVCQAPGTVEVRSEVADTAIADQELVAEEVEAVSTFQAQPATFDHSPAVAVAVAPSPVIAVKPAILETPLPEGFNLVHGAGSAYEIGKQHGSNQAVQIRAIMERYAAMLGPRLQNIPELEEALATPTLYFCEDDLEELHGIADGAGLPVPAVIAHNLGMYPDYVPGCTQFAVTAKNNSGIGLVHAVNEDSPLSLTLPDCLSRIVQVRMPRGRIPHVTFSVSGQAGGLNGVNAMGIAVSSTLLLDRPRRAGTTTGKVHPVIVKRILERASTIEEAVEIVRGLDRVGAWSLCISHYLTDRICYLEYDGKSLAVKENLPYVLTTNHCLLQPPVADVPEHSKHRLARLHQLLGEQADGNWTLERAQKTLRDQYDLGRGRQTTHATMNTVRRVDNQISVVMLPATGELWVTPGPRAKDRQDEYFRFNLNELLQSAVAGDKSGELDSGRIVLNSAALWDGLPTESQTVVQRHVMRAVAEDLPAGLPEMPKLNGPVLLLGDTVVGEELKAKLSAQGATVHVLPHSADADAAVAELNRLWAIAPAPHLIISTAREDGATATEANWAARAPRGMHVPYFVCQRWVQLVQEAGLVGQATLAAVTALGGDFGFGGRIAGVEGGGLMGLFKAIRREVNGLVVKAIDAPAEESPAQLAGYVLKELAAATPQCEVGYLRGTRLVPKAVPQPASTQRRAVKVPHGTWVVTGGARGVTAVVARELGKRFGLSMHLLGSTQLPSIDPTWKNLTDEGMKALKRTISEQARAAGKNPAQAWKDIERAIEIDRTLQAFRADGVKAVYHACDVSDRASLSATLDAIRKADGSIHGIIHGAGVESACKFEKKKRENVLATFGVKVDAAMTLLELTGLDPIGWFIGFGSTSGRFGGLGQTDYSLASDLLCKICDWTNTRRPDVAAVGFHWPPWADVGMAARPESKLALKSGGLAFMPPLEGVAHVVHELSTLMLEGEILCIDKPDSLDLDKTMVTGADKQAYLDRDPTLRTMAIVDGVQDLHAGKSLVATARFNPMVEPFLLEHRHQGVPILPAVVGMETMAEAALVLAGGGKKVVGVRDMAVHQGFRFHTLRSQSAQVIAKHVEGGIRCELRADFCDRNGRLVEPNRLQMEATIELGDAYAPIPQPDLGPVPTSWTKHKYADDWQTMKYPDDGRIYHGYPLQGMKEFSVVEGGVWGKIVVPMVSDLAGERDVDGWLLPSATIDCGLLGCDIMIWKVYRSARLPKGVDRIRISRPLRDGEQLTYRMWLVAPMTANFLFMDSAGHVVLQVDGFHMFEVKAGLGVVGRADIPPGSNVPGTPTFIERRAKPRSELAPKFVADERVAELPLIDSARWINDKELYAELKFDPTKDIFLQQHKMTGRPILPAVIGMESMIEAASLALPGKHLGVIRDFLITSGMRFKTDDPMSVRVKVRVENGAAKCEMVGLGDNPKLYQSATIEFGDAPLAVTVPPPGQPPFPYNPMMYPDEAQLIHGPMFRALKQLFLHRDGGWAIIAGYPINNMAGTRKGDKWFLPPAMFDSCLVAAGVDMFIQLEKRVEVPYACEEFKLVRLPKPKEQCVLRLKYRGHTDRHTSYDFTLYGADNTVIWTGTNYRGIVTGMDGDASAWDGQVNLES